MIHVKKFSVLISLCIATGGVGIPCVGQESPKLELGFVGTRTLLAIGTDSDIILSESGIRLRRTGVRGLSMGVATGGSEEKDDANVAELFIPASLTKMITGFLAVRELGADFRFTTTLFWDNLDSAGNVTNLRIESNGDPQFATVERPENFLRNRMLVLVKELRKQGVQRITGPVSLQSLDTRLDQAAHIEGSESRDDLACYAAHAQSLNFNRNCAGLQISGPNSAKWLARGIALPVSLNMSLGARAFMEIVPQFGEFAGIIGYQVHGVWRPGARLVGLSLPVSDTQGWFGTAFLDECARQGIKTAEAWLDKSDLRLETRARRLIVQSDSLGDLLPFMNKPSDNFLADALFRAVAVKGDDLDIQTAGQRIVRRRIREWLVAENHPEFANEIEIKDGAGLSRTAFVSPRALLLLLRYFAQAPEFKVLWRSLPIAGVDGTLRHRMRGTAAAGKVRAKTGAVHGAYQLAGYIPRLGSDGAQEFVPFVMLSSASPQTEFAVLSFQDKLVAELAKRLGATTF